MPYAFEGGVSTGERPGGIYITDAQYLAAIEGMSHDKRVTIKDGFALVDVASPEPAQLQTLEQVKAALIYAVDAGAEVERAKYITPGSGQAMTYMQKADEAVRFLAAVDPAPENYPLLAAEVGITADDMRGVATIVHAAYAQWQMIGGQIEAARLSTKNAIDAAATVEQAEAAAAAIAYPF